MNNGTIEAKFSSKKLRRTCEWLVRQFSSEKNLIFPSSSEEYIKISKERGLGMQYRDGVGKTYFPTEKGWKFFLDFTDSVQKSEPFLSRSTKNDTYQNFNRAFAKMLSEGVLPDRIEDLVDYLPSEFIQELSSRSERVFSKINGIHFEGEFFFRVGHCWIGNYGSVSFDCVRDHDRASKENTLEALSRVYENDTPIMAGGNVQGTSDCVKQECTFQCELALSILAVLLNMTYEAAFGRLWQLRRVDRPEYGLSKQFNFSLIHHDVGELSKDLGVSTKYVDQWFRIDEKLIDRWYDYLALTTLNRIVCVMPDSQTELVERLINALLYFRQAADQRTSEMQISTLWICVESFFTANNEQVLNAILPGLLAMTISSLRPEYWPNKAKSLEELRRVFAKYYHYRSRTFHHGRRGHVAAVDVQEFSIVVSNLIIGITHMINAGYKSADDLLEASNQFVQRNA